MMNDHTPIERTESALLQAGAGNDLFSGESLELEERSKVSCCRLLGFDPITGFPNETGRCSGDDPVVLCLGPGEWLALSEALPAENLLEDLQQEVRSAETTFHDLSDALAVFRMRGSGAPWLLGKLSGLDFLGGVSAGAHCARTRMGQLAVTVHYRESKDKDPVFDLIVDRSYASYFWQLLIESSAHADDLARTHGDAVSVAPPRPETTPPA